MTACQNILSIENGQLAWENSGKGLPLVLAHGFSFNKRSWDVNLNSFLENYHVINYDLRGFGHSSIPYTSYNHADDLLKLIDHLELTRPVLMGVSLGANVMLEFAAKYPHRVKGLILISPGLPGFKWDSARPPEEAAAFAHKHGIEAGKQYWLNHALFKSLDDFPQAKQAIASMVAEYNGWHWQNDNMLVWDMDLPEKLKNIDIETLIISGEKDVDGYRKIAHHLANEINNSRLITVKNAGHMLNIERPRTFADMVIKFINNLRGA